MPVIWRTVKYRNTLPIYLLAILTARSLALHASPCTLCPKKIMQVQYAASKRKDYIFLPGDTDTIDGLIFSSLFRASNLCAL